MKIGSNACKTKNIGFVTIRVTFPRATSNTFRVFKKYQRRSKAIWA
jgi:hypothetical protein